MQPHRRATKDAQIFPLVPRLAVEDAFLDPVHLQGYLVSQTVDRFGDLHHDQFKQRRDRGEAVAFS